MIGGLKKTTSRFAILAAAGLMMGAYNAPASAADLGGDCCADLEERVAELEATTVRKGNRKISVTLYGWVNQGVLWYDNGEESDVYVTNVDTATSRIGVKGSGTLRPGVEAGYRIELAVNQANVSGLSENDGDDDGAGLSVRHAFWWVNSEQLGKLSVGQTGTASDGTIDGVDLSGAGGWISYNGHADWVFSFGIIESASDDEGDSDLQLSTGNLWGFMSAFDAQRANVVKYDTPTFAGFTASASWGEDDRYDLGLNYSNNWNGLEVAAGLGYYWSNDEYCEQHPSGVTANANGTFSNNGGCGTQFGIEGDHEVFGGSLSMYHAATGLFATGSYAHAEGGLNTNDGFLGSVQTTDADQWYAKLGVRKNWFGHGETAIYAEYGETNVTTPFGAALSIFGAHGDFAVGGTLADDTLTADGTMWGVGIGQDFDSLGATAYIGYRHHEASITDCDGAISLTTGCAAADIEKDRVEDMDAVLAGMVVPF